jgi:preprotein translocase subunit YajC
MIMGLRSRDPERVVVETIFCSLAGNVALFAQKTPQGNEPSPLIQLLFPVVAIIVLFYFMMIRPQRREQSRRQDMLSGVKKNDRIITIGGIHGVVTNVDREADKVTIRVDDSTNTKLQVTMSSISRIVGDEPTDESAKK